MTDIIKTEHKEVGLYQAGLSLFLDAAKFEHAQRVAKLLASSSMVPEQFQGPEKGIANCVIALNLAERMGVDPFMLMQNMYIVHGKPGLEAKLAIALVNGCGRFEPLEFEFDGEKDTRRCRAFAKDIKSKKVLYSVWVTWAMAKAEGWVDKSGSKWKTMPDLMFTYRSAMFFARVNAPEVLLGLQTKEEIEDIIDMEPVRKIEGTLKKEEVTYEIKEAPEPEPSTTVEVVEETEENKDEPPKGKEAAPMETEYFECPASKNHKRITLPMCKRCVDKDTCTAYKIRAEVKG